MHHYILINGILTIGKSWTDRAAEWLDAHEDLQAKWATPALPAP